MRTILKWASLVALFFLFSCTHVEESGDFAKHTKPGVYGSMSPVLSVDEPDSKASVNPETLGYVFEIGDHINIWASSGTLLIYNVEEVSNEGKNCKFIGGGFTLTENETYYSAVPLIRKFNDNFHSLSTTFEDQAQLANGDASHLAEYTYAYASSVCAIKNGVPDASFSYSRLNAFMKFELTLPKVLTLKKLEIYVQGNEDFFGLNGTSDIATGAFTAVAKDSVMVLQLGGAEGLVVDGQLNAYLAIAPTQPAEYIIRLTDTDNKVYTSPKIQKPAIPANMFTRFTTAVVEGENPAVAKIGDVLYETLEAAFAAAKDGDTITLLANSSGNGIIAPQGKFGTEGLTVDFGGFTYTMDGAMVGSTGTQTQAFQLLKDNKITFKNGTIESSKALMLIQNYSDLTLQGMTLNLNTTGSNNLYTLSNNNGTVVIDGSTINAATTPNSFAFDVCRYSSYPKVDVTVKGGSTINGNVEISASGSDAKDGFKLMLDTGVINGDLVVDASAAAAMAATPTKAIIMEKDSFEQPAPAGFKWVSNNDGTSNLVACEYVAQIGETKYETLEAAFAAAEDGDTITLLADCAGNGIIAPEGKFAQGLTVDFNGHTYNFSGKGVGSANTENNGFQLLRGNTITFTNGAITTSSEDAGFLIQNYSNLTLENMNIDGTGVWGGYVISNNNGNTVINNTTITAPTGAFAFDVCRYSSYPSVSVTVKGTSVINGNIEVSASGNDPKDGLSLTISAGTINGKLLLHPSGVAVLTDNPDKAVVTKANNVNLTAPSGFKWLANEDGITSILVPCEYVAQIGDSKYETLEEAWNAVLDGQTITLLADCAGNGIVAPEGKFTSGVTVDFGGFTYTMDGAMVGSTGTQTQAFQLLKDNKITFKNGTITSDKAKMLVQNYSNLTLDGMTLTLNNPNYTSAYTLSNNNGNVVIKDTEINANPAGGFAFDVCRYSSYPSVNVTVQGTSAINGDIEVSASGSNAMDGFSLTVNGGTVTGNLVIDPSAKAAMQATPGKAKVIKDNDVVLEAPAGFNWAENDADSKILVPKVYVAKIGTAEYETLEEAFAAVQDGQTITLLADCAGNGIQAPQGKFTNGITVDFGGFTYTMDGAMVGSTGTQTQAFQLLKDNKITFKNGTIYSEKALMLVQNYSDLTLDGMTLTLANPSYTSAYTLSNNNGNVVIKDTEINANTAGGFAFDVCRYSSYPSVNVTVQGTSEINGDIEVSASGSNAMDGFGLTINGGTVTGNLVIDPSAKAAMQATPDKAKVIKANGVALEAPAGFNWADNDSNSKILVPKVYVAKIGTVEYETLEEAFAAAQDGQTITLLADCAGNGIVAPQGKFTNGITVDFGGFTYTMDGAMVGSTGTQTQAFQLLKDNKITFKNGTIESSKALMLIQNYSDLTLQGMTLNLNTTGSNNLYTLSNNNGTVVIDGSTINAATTPNSFAFDVCRYSSYTSVNVTVKGNSAINGNIEFDAGGGDPKDGASLTLESASITGGLHLTTGGATALTEHSDKAFVKKADAIALEAPDNFKWVANGDGTSTLVPVSYVAQVGDVKYETLVEAVAATNSGTITLLKDAEGAGIFVVANANKNITIDFNGHSYTVTGPAVGSSGTQSQAFHLEEGNTVVLTGGTVSSTNNSGVAMLVQNYSNLTVENMVLDGTNLPGSNRYTLSNNCGTVVIDNSTINAKSGNFAFDVCRYATYPSVSVTVKGNSAINGNIEFDAGGGDPKNGASLTLESAAITGSLRLTTGGATALTDHPDKAFVKKADAIALEVPDNFKWAANGDGTSTLAPVNIAQIGSNKYESLQAALDAAYEMTGDVTITLLASTKGYSIVHQKTGLNLTIEGAAKLINGQIIIDGDGNLSGTETLTINNVKYQGDKTNFCSGTDAFVSIPYTKDVGAPYSTGKYNYAHNVTVSNCTFTSTSTILDVVAVKVPKQGAANISITGCTGTNLHSLAQLTSTEGGSITNNNVTNSDSFANISGGKGVFAISGNTFTSVVTDGYGVRENAASEAILNLADNNLTANSSIVLGKSASATKGTININSGTYNGTIVKDIAETATGKIVITGGTFSADPSAYVAEGYQAVQSGSNYIVQPN